MIHYYQIILSPPSASMQRRFLQKLLAHVIPSPVGPAIVMVQWPSPPIPTPAFVQLFLT